MAIHLMHGFNEITILSVDMKLLHKRINLSRYWERLDPRKQLGGSK